MEDIDTVTHSAAASHVDCSLRGPATFVQTNVVGTFTLLEAICKSEITQSNHGIHGRRQFKYNYKTFTTSSRFLNRNCLKIEDAKRVIALKRASIFFIELVKSER